eukprot:scaffold8526_cov153-Amphora_coffeaeformis.AAC.2
MSENEEFLSEHTLAMRKAVDACQSLLSPCEKDGTSSSSAFWVDLLPDLVKYSTSSSSVSLNERRDKVLAKWKDEQYDNCLETIHHDPNEESSPSLSWYFRQHFHQNNQPCRIQGLKESCFRRVKSIWSSPQVFRQWMRQVFPPSPRNDDDERSSHLPVRRGSTQEATLDAEGRATECITVNMALEEWIAYLDCEYAQDSNDKTKDYLKDFHFEAFLEDQKLLDSELYQVPCIFEHDLLNPFLRAFTKGDYRFVYWGPAGSRTDWHSDVLNSFSWSYNVFGCKEWTFQVPQSNRYFKIVQKTGECIFVPATWKHQVVNLEETLSINRNWLTASNLDLCWNCLTTEIRSIENELASWGSDYDWEARESMLRGCVGLDVTAFYLLVLYRLAAIRQEVTLETERGRLFGPDAAFEVQRCAETLRTLLDDQSLHLEERLTATLVSGELAKAVQTLGRL